MAVVPKIRSGAGRALTLEQLRWAIAWASTGRVTHPLLAWLTHPCPQVGRFLWVNGRNAPHGRRCPTCHGRNRIPMPTEQFAAFARFGLAKSGFSWRMEADDDRSVRTQFWRRDDPRVKAEATEGDGYTSTLRAAYRATLAAGWRPGAVPAGS